MQLFLIVLGVAIIAITFGAGVVGAIPVIGPLFLGIEKLGWLSQGGWFLYPVGFFMIFQGLTGSWIWAIAGTIITMVVLIFGFGFI